MLGLNFLADNQVDQAIDELTQATSGSTDALEIQMILGNLYRQKGQVGRAINIHQTLLQRPNLTKLEHAYVLLCLGLDFRHGGFVDRALEAFHEVVRLDPQNRYALVNLQKLHEEQQQWTEAAAIREQHHDDRRRRRNARDQQILAFLRNQIGARRRASGDADAAARDASATRIDIDARTAPAYLNLGDVRSAGQHRRGDRVVGAPGQSGARPRVPGVRAPRARATAGRRASPVRRPVRAADRAQPAGLARPARAVAPLRRRGADPRRRSNCC